MLRFVWLDICWIICDDTDDMEMLNFSDFYLKVTAEHQQREERKKTLNGPNSITTTSEKKNKNKVTTNLFILFIFAWEINIIDSAAALPLNWATAQLETFERTYMHAYEHIRKWNQQPAKESKNKLGQKEITWQLWNVMYLGKFTLPPTPHNMRSNQNLLRKGPSRRKCTWKGKKE